MKNSFFLRSFVLFFGLLLLGIQIYNFCYVKNLDKQYSDIITDKTQTLQAFEIISYESSNIQRTILNTTLFKDKTLNTVQARIYKSQKRIDSQFTKLHLHLVSLAETASISNLENKFSIYRHQYETIIPMLKKGEGGRLAFEGKLEIVKSSYEIFSKEEDRQTDFFRMRAESQSDGISEKTKRTSGILLFIGTLPYLVLIAGLFISVFIVLTLGNILNWFRHQE